MWELRRLSPTLNQNRQKTENIVIDKGLVFTSILFNTPKTLLDNFHISPTNNNVIDFSRVIIRGDSTGIIMLEIPPKAQYRRMKSESFGQD
jgi:hypothetical protein